MIESHEEFDRMVERLTFKRSNEIAYDDEHYPFPCQARAPGIGKNQIKKLAEG